MEEGLFKEKTGIDFRQALCESKPLTMKRRYKGHSPLIRRNEEDLEKRREMEVFGLM